MGARATIATEKLLPETLSLGPVQLTITDLERSIGFYEDVIGLSVLVRNDESHATLGAGDRPLIELVEDPTARRPARQCGLYHFALLFTDRAELARAAIRIAESRTPIQGASDHHTHEAIYLADPDGNGIELAADRPRERWPDRIDPNWMAKGPDPLDVEDLLAQIAGEPPRATAADGLRVGHLHLHVGDIEQGLAFYRDALGFEVQGLLDSAAFVSAGGYHHHLAFNVWRGRDIAPAEDGVIGLRHWTIVIDDPAIEQVRRRLDAAGYGYEILGGGILVRDPFNIALAVVPPGSR